MTVEIERNSSSWEDMQRADVASIEGWGGHPVNVEVHAGFLDLNWDDPAECCGVSVTAKVGGDVIVVTAEAARKLASAISQAADYLEHYEIHGVLA